MNRRTFIERLGAAAAFAAVPAWACTEVGARMTQRSGQEIEKLEKSDEEWRELLDPDEYRILIDEKTEAAHSSPLDDEHRTGTFICAACHLPLFESETKFDSGTGWPSFYAAIEGHVATKRDFKLLLPRTEYHCARCGGHQGHIFDDGPPPTGKRFCNNGLALDFVPESEELPALRT